MKKCNDILYPIVSEQIELKNCINKDLLGLSKKSESIINECANDYK